MKCIYGNSELVKTKIIESNGNVLDQQSISLLDQKKVDDIYSARHMFNLSTKAQQIFAFIRSRTFTFNKVKEIISLDHFQNGVYSKGDLVTMGTRLSKRTIQRALEELIDYGIIKKQRRQYRGSNTWSQFEINVQFFNDEILQYRKEQKMKKKKKTTEEIAAENSFLNEKVPDSFKAKKQLKEDDTHTNVVVSGVTPGSVTGGVIRTTLRESINHPTGNTSNFSNCNNLQEFKKFYADRFNHYFPGSFLPMSQKEHGQLKHYFLKITQIEYLTVSDFIEYCFSNWDYIVKNKLGFLEKYTESDLPNCANINILLKFTDKFLDGYRETEEEFTPKFGDAIDFRIKELTKRGCNLDVATKRAVYEDEYRKEKNNRLEDKLEQSELKKDIEHTKLLMEYQKALDLLNKENEKLKTQLRSQEVKPFTMNDFSNDDLKDMGID